MKNIVELIELEKKYKSEEAELNAVFNEEKKRISEQYESKIKELMSILNQKDDIINTEVEKKVKEIQQSIQSTEKEKVNVDMKKIERTILDSLNNQ